MSATTPLHRKFQRVSSSMQDALDDRALASFTEHEQKEIQLMTDIFNTIDADKTGTITQEEFRKYVQMNPRGWPLVDLFRAKTMNQNERDLLVNFWFRKLDTDGDGSVAYADFMNMFFALRCTKVQESLYTDFLINLFDDNMDGRIDKAEFTKMMHVLFGEEPPAAVLYSMPDEGFDREALTRVMHSVSMDYQLLPSSVAIAGGHQSGMYNVGVSESRVWNSESGVFEVAPLSDLQSPVSPKVNVFGNTGARTKSATTSAATSGAVSTAPGSKEEAKRRNRERKRAADGVSLVLAVTLTAAITAGLCVFAGVYGRKIGKF